MDKIIPMNNHKGDWCEKINRTCQEGYCEDCEIYQISRR